MNASLRNHKNVNIAATNFFPRKRPDQMVKFYLIWLYPLWFPTISHLVINRPQGWNLAQCLALWGNIPTGVHPNFSSGWVVKGEKRKGQQSCQKCILVKEAIQLSVKCHLQQRMFPQVQRCCWAPWLSEQLCELGNEACTGDYIILSLNKAFSISGAPEHRQKHKNGFNVFIQWIDLFLLKPALS